MQQKHILNLQNRNEYYSEHQILEVTHHTPLTDKMGLIFFELPKIPGDIDRHNLRLLWLALFKADTEEELKKIEALGVPELNQAISAYHSVTASAEFREIERLREKAAHDEAQALYNAEQRGEAIGIAKGIAKGKAEGKAEGESVMAFAIARNMIRRKRPIEEIVEDTGLTRNEVEGLYYAD